MPAVWACPGICLFTAPPALTDNSSPGEGIRARDASGGSFMSRITRTLLLAFAAVIILLVVAAAALPLFLNGDSFRARIETALSKSLNRKVTIGKVDLSVFSGGLVATNTVIADDPNFSTQPFMQVDTVKIRVKPLPLLLHKEIRIRGFALDTPKVDLLRAANGKWNYSTLGSSPSQASSAQQSTGTVPDLTAGSIEIEHGQITVGTVPATPGVTDHVYQQVDLSVKDFGPTKSFPFTLTADLPAGGSVSLKGTAGPFNERDTAETPFTAHLEVKRLDPLASGFVTAADGISGLIDSLQVDASYSGQAMHISKLLVDTPRLTVVQSNKPKTPPPAGEKKSSMLDNLSVDDAEVKNGTLTLTTAGKPGAPAVYQALNAQVTNLTPKTSSPFSASAELPGGGKLDARGNAGPFNQQNSASTPVNAKVSLTHFNLGTAGVLPPDAGVSGIADLQAQVQSNGEQLDANGTAHVAGIKLAKAGQPSNIPVNLQFALMQNERALTGQIQRATVTVGKAVINIAGTYQTSGPTTALNLKVDGNAVPIDEIETFLPALGVHTPEGSQLRGGSVTTALAVTGSTAAPIISGPVRVDNTQLAGFDLGAKLGPLTRLTGGKIGAATGSGTNIKLLSMDVREAGGGIRTDKVDLAVAGVGTATGAGSVSEGGALDYNMVLKLTDLVGGGAASAPAASQASNSGAGGLAGGLAGLIPGGAGGSVKGLGSLGGLTGGMLKGGIPVTIAGTTSHPVFTPNIRGLTAGIGAGAAQQVLGKQGGTPAAGSQTGSSVKSARGGLLGKH